MTTSTRDRRWATRGGPIDGCTTTRRHDNNLCEPHGVEVECICPCFYCLANH